ncbi:MAG: ROK family protein [Caldisericia bacterium]|nr:ROK family protein [Caldisericia bacterium]
MLAVDFGGTNLRIADVSGRSVRNKQMFPSPQNGEELIDILGRYLAGVDYTVGISVAGLIDPETGHFIHLSSQKISDFPFSQVMLKKHGIKTKLINDCKAGALAQMYYGSAIGLKNFVYLTFSTGIGAGVVIDGKILMGANGLAGEVGHMSLIPNEFPCNCGRMGCWNVVSSGLYFSNKGLDAAKVFESARNGDPEAHKHVEWIARWNGIGVANVINAFDPEAVVIGGSLTKSWDVFAPKMFEHIKENLCLSRDPGTIIRLAGLGDDGCMIGAWLNTRCIG